MSNLAIVLTALAAVITAATPGFLSWMQSRKTHRLVNSRLTELLNLTRESAKAEGRLEGESAKAARRRGNKTK